MTSNTEMEAIIPNKIPFAYYRHEQTMILRLRIGHCRLRSHMKKIGIEESVLCPWGQEAQTTAHVLQLCPLHKEERETTWPTESSLGNKLHGTATVLHRTVRIMLQTSYKVHINKGSFL